MSSSIDELQKRIADLQGTASQSSSSPIKVQEVASTSESSDLKTLIREVLREEIQSLKDSTLVRAEPVEVPKQELNLLQAIGTCLTNEEQLWLSKPEILGNVDKRLASYFQTEEGSESLKKFIKYFKGFYEN